LKPIEIIIIYTRKKHILLVLWITKFVD